VKGKMQSLGQTPDIAPPDSGNNFTSQAITPQSIALYSNVETLRKFAPDYDLHEIIAPIRANTVAETDNAEHEANAVATGVVASVLDPNQAILRIESFSTPHLDDTQVQ
jgi:hypothetical protein